MSIIDDLLEQRENINRQIEEIQEQCSHPVGGVKKSHGASTGNYDPTENCYWTDFHCSLCDKKWSEDGSL